MPPDNRPIGHWIRQADVLLTTGIDRVQACCGLTRTGWQVLHTIHDHAPDLPALIDYIRPFAAKEALTALLREFSAQELLLDSDRELQLSQTGIDLHTRCLAMQQEFRKSVMNRIPEQDYGTAVSVLQKIVENIESRNEE